MIIKRRIDFNIFNRVINTLDYIIASHECNPYYEKDYPQELKDKFLRYAMIHYLYKDKVTMNFTEQEFGEFNFLEGFAYAIGTNEGNEVDYVKQLQDKYDAWVKENPEKREG